MRQSASVWVNTVLCVHVQWLELDGKSLTIQHLIKIGRGEYRVKVCSIHSHACMYMWLYMLLVMLSLAYMYTAF